ncbi:MAG: hypothetical protein GF418_17300 [Chitinivibrionales bacterium]|nr:hypothetical protein [Chitinivibrionales bacterium]MBD3397377.1 hypothetical protein [Chitinivibrionales bacterium]
MCNKRIHTVVCLLLAGLVAAAQAAPHRKAVRRKQDVVGGPQGAYPYLCKGVSRKNLLDIPSYHPWSILHHKKFVTDTLHVIAVRVQFQTDSSELTTGIGEFGIAEGNTPTRSDREEMGYYPDKGGDGYKYDDLPHDRDYFERQLQFAQNYFMTVSRGKFYVDYTVDPRVFEVPKQMTKYSPGAKKPKESWDDYYYRRTVGLMEFVLDAVHESDNDGNGAFAALTQDAETGILYLPDSSDTSKKVRAAVLLIHAGASYWTDGGEAGYFGQDTPSDMIDAFISPDFFDYFKDTLAFDTMTIGTGDGPARGIKAAGRDGTLLLDEFMMVSETSNQDSLNWGTHGILVNQIARQVGIPDLHSNQSEVGSFCIMDIAGYSAGRGFIPPWPSAWVRAFMGWETPVVADIDGGTATYRLTAVGDTSVTEDDTTILLIPINDHEYYLLENRQRNLTSDTAVFNYEWSHDSEHVFIDPYDQVNLKKNARALGDSKVLDSVKNYDVSIPASGVLVWHIDENLIRDRLGYNVLNADSLYGAVSIVEADGINDLGILFMDVLFQAAFDYGGAEDVFPHTTQDREGGDTTIFSFGPFTRPSTKSNDGGHTYLTISIDGAGRRADGARAKEKAAIRDYYVLNTVDSVFEVTVGRDASAPAVPGWPKRALPSKFYEPVLCDVFANGDSLELAVLDTTGRLYIWPAGDNPAGRFASFGSETDSTIVLDLQGNVVMTYEEDTTINGADTVIHIAESDTAFSRGTYLRKVPGPVSFPTAIDGRLFVPSSDNALFVLDSIVSPDSSHNARWDTVGLPAPASSYVCNYTGRQWAVGCKDGTIVFGDGTSVTSQLAPDSSRESPVQALALLDTSSGRLAAIHKNGMLITCMPGASKAQTAKRIRNGIAPYTLAAADLNALDSDDAPDIVVSDIKQGLWLFKARDTLALAPHWTNDPNEWPVAYHYFEEDDDPENRRLLPDNPSAPALVDLNADGALDIVAGGTNGIYAFNYKGVLLDGWPSELDNRYWYQRGSIIAAPVVGVSPDKKEPRVVFSSPTGENPTFAVARIDSAPKNTGRIFYTFNDGSTDSIGGLSQSLIDTLLVFGDSVILPFITPGGYIDAVNPAGKRPDTTRSFSHVGTVRQSYWPLSTGGAVSTSPLLCDIDRDGRVDIIAVSNTGAAYRFEMHADVLSDSLVWGRAGYNDARVFAYLGPPPSATGGEKPRITYFYNYPNPTGGIDETIFRYKFAAPAANVRLDIFTYTGYHVYSAKGLPTSFPDADEHTVSLGSFGPGAYRCRLEAKVNGLKQVKYWKMAVVK